MDEYIKKSDAIAALGECPEVWRETEAEWQAVCDWNRYRDRILAVPGIFIGDDGK